MSVEFTVKKVVIRPGGNEDVHLFIEDELSKLITQLCEDGYASVVLDIISRWRMQGQEACSD